VWNETVPDYNLFEQNGDSNIFTCTKLPRYNEPIRLPNAPGLTFTGLRLVARSTARTADYGAGLGHARLAHSRDPVALPTLSRRATAAPNTSKDGRKRQPYQLPSFETQAFAFWAKACLPGIRTESVETMGFMESLAW
jgi:hypothetical protein